MPNIFSVHAVITGEVQGVGYRWFVQRTAQAMKLSGWVRNLPDGAVEVDAEGDKDSLITFLDLLKDGHSSAFVEGIKTDWHDADNGKNEGFEIRL